MYFCNPSLTEEYVRHLSQFKAIEPSKVVDPSACTCVFGGKSLEMLKSTASERLRIFGYDTHVSINKNMRSRAAEVINKCWSQMHTSNDISDKNIWSSTHKDESEKSYLAKIGCITLGKNGSMVYSQEEFEKYYNITCHPFEFSKRFVNHRHPKNQNNEVMQRIKGLEPEQHIAQRIIKRNIIKGQINRQNKNYMFETSCKKNRRSMLQRNHSGANNNRKC
ncbi:uncharacterized protein CEXT_550131 [Caerostris extrusa]|uniref:Uncharacterized protein n=1 Tax=Caerostris extrusa TaxID=172846 RepID=A0AAV4XJG3_CAEEX|nr:uncharacterized protein CEXT_550131 [Caerostris extrusa]